MTAGNVRVTHASGDPNLRAKKELYMCNGLAMPLLYDNWLVGLALADKLSTKQGELLDAHFSRSDLIIEKMQIFV